MFKIITYCPNSLISRSVQIPKWIMGVFIIISVGLHVVSKPPEKLFESIMLKDRSFNQCSRTSFALTPATFVSWIRISSRFKALTILLRAKILGECPIPLALKDKIFTGAVRALTPKGLVIVVCFLLFNYSTTFYLALSKKEGLPWEGVEGGRGEIPPNDDHHFTPIGMSILSFFFVAG